MFGARVDHRHQITVGHRHIHRGPLRVGRHPLGVAGEVSEPSAETGDGVRDTCRSGIDDRDGAGVFVGDVGAALGIEDHPVGVLPDRHHALGEVVQVDDDSVVGGVQGHHQVVAVG